MDEEHADGNGQFEHITEGSETTSKPLDFCKLVAGMSDESLDQITLQNPPDYDLLKHFASCPTCRNRIDQVLSNSFDKLGPGLGEAILDVIESEVERYAADRLSKEKKN